MSEEHSINIDKYDFHSVQRAVDDGVEAVTAYWRLTGEKEWRRLHRKLTFEEQAAIDGGIPRSVEDALLRECEELEKADPPTASPPAVQKVPAIFESPKAPAVIILDEEE